MQLQGLTRYLTLCSVGGEYFVQFTMSPTKVGDDVYMYEQLVEPVLQSGMPLLDARLNSTMGKFLEAMGMMPRSACVVGSIANVRYVLSPDCVVQKTCFFWLCQCISADS